MEKESLTRKFLFNGYNLSLILVQYVLVSVPHACSIFAANPSSHRSMILSRMFLEGGGGGITIELGSCEVFSAFSKKAGYALSSKDKNYV